jgi:hypothetical protein
MNSVYVGDKTFDKIVFIESEPRASKETGEQESRDGLLRWNVDVTVKPHESLSRNGKSRPETIRVTVNAKDDPGTTIAEFTEITFIDLKMGWFEAKTGGIVTHFQANGIQPVSRARKSPVEG